jgi:hypothetical protein
MKPRICTFLKPDGLPCRAFALTGSTLCHAHNRLQARQRRQYKALMPPAIRLGPLADRLSIHRALIRILRVIAANSIPLERSEAIFYRIMRAQARYNRAAPPPALTGTSLEPRTVPHLLSLPLDTTINQTLSIPNSQPATCNL